MEVTPLKIEGAYVFSPVIHADDRGSFLESFRADVFKEVTGHPFRLAQANTSVSEAGTIRGIHFAQLPPSQAKYVSCAGGSILDVVVDLRTGSPTYGQWEAVELDDQNRRAVYVSEGLGHGFIALSENTVVNYLCSAPYAPGREHGINPYDPALGIDWPTRDPLGAPLAHRLSPKDSSAPTLAEAEKAGVLPSIEEARAFQESLRAQ